MWNSTKEPVLKEETYLISAVQQHPKYELINWKLQYPPLEGYWTRGGGGGGGVGEERRDNTWHI